MSTQAHSLAESKSVSESVSWTIHLGNPEKYHLEGVSIFINRFAESFNKRFPLRRLEVHVDQQRNSSGNPKQSFAVKLHALLQSGKILLSTAHGDHVVTALRGAIRKMKYEVEISDRQKHSFVLLRPY